MTAASCSQARAIDAAAIAKYGLPERALVETAGKGCAEKLEPYAERPIVLLAGPGNNAADTFCAALSLLRTKSWRTEELSIVLRSEKESLKTAGVDSSVFASRLRALALRGVKTFVWTGPEGEAGRAIREGRLLIDGLTGTGLAGRPRGETAEIISFVNKLRYEGTAGRIIAVDMPSGLSDASENGEGILAADATLAIEPVKSCLYRPFARPLAGTILPVLGVFPSALLKSTVQTEIYDFSAASKLIAPVPGDAYKHRRGLVEIHAGSVGATGAAKLAVRGAAAAGAGLIRVIADADTWPVLAASETGAMVKKGFAEAYQPKADAYLVGPGWGSTVERKSTLLRLLGEKAAFVLDADALRMLAKIGGEGRIRFSGTEIATPHPGEFAIFSGCRKEELDADPDSILLRTAAERNLVILFKGHVMRIAAPDGRFAYVDGMEPVLSVGGSGDVLAGLTAGIAGRMYRASREEGTDFDPFPVAVAAAALLIEAGKKARTKRGFCDAAEFACCAGKIAGDAWLREDRF